MTVCYSRFCQTYTFFLYWTKTVPSRILAHYIGAIYIFIPMKIIVQFLECKIPERVLLTGAMSVCKKFSKVSHRCGAKCLSLLAIFTFWVFTLWHITIVLYSKRKSKRLWHQKLSLSKQDSTLLRAFLLFYLFGNSFWIICL